MSTGKPRKTISASAKTHLTSVTSAYGGLSEASRCGQESLNPHSDGAVWGPWTDVAGCSSDHLLVVSNSNVSYLKQKGKVLEEYRGISGKYKIIEQPGLGKEESRPVLGLQWQLMEVLTHSTPVT